MGRFRPAETKCDDLGAGNFDIIREFDMSDNTDLSARAQRLSTLARPAYEHKWPCGILANVMRTGCLQCHKPVYSITGINVQLTVTTVCRISQ